MPKFKNLLPNIFGGKDTQKVNNAVGKLETDALPVDDPEEHNANGLAISTNSTPTASADLTAAVVRELSDPNYNSLEVVPSTSAISENDGAVATNGPTMNTMNVHNAEQQLVMQFSNVNKLHFGSVYNFNSNISASSSRKNSCADEAAPMSPTDTAKRQTPRKTTSIVVMMQSKEEPNHRMLDTIATHLGEGWKQVMRDLGLSEGQIEQAIIDHQVHGGIKEVIYQLLLQWLRNAEDNTATLGHITTLLWETNHRDCVQRMKLVWKWDDANKKTKR